MKTSKKEIYKAYGIENEFPVMEGFYMKTFVCTYINSKGHERTKRFDSFSAWSDFCALLDKRIAKGTCGGYIASII